MESLHEIERVFGFKYPPVFVSELETLIKLLSTKLFRRNFNPSRLLLSVSNISSARENLPSGLLPFMPEEQWSSPDVYAFDLHSPGPEFRVVVWAGDAIVAEWWGFSDFITWICERMAPAPPTD